MKIYTKTGDDGTTGLIGGQRVQKSDRRIDCIGVVDELNASIGWASVVATSELLSSLRQIQSELFVIGSHLALPQNNAKDNQWLPALDEAIVTRLETQIDAAEQQLPALRNFILPGGSELAARLHVARTICRRAEREIVSFSQDHPIAGIIVRYLNRLSDWLFVHARLANQLASVRDIPWENK